MKISLSFAELSEYINKHYGKKLGFSKVSDKELCISYEQNIFFRTIQVPINISIDEVRTDSIVITYNGGFGIDMIITGTLSFLKARVPELANALISKEGHHIHINLAKLPQTAKLVETVALQSISVAENSIIIEASLK